MGLGLSTLEAVADALYAGSPQGFVAGRAEAATAARRAGDRTLAQAISKLRRPTLGAWYVNVAIRASLVSVREWLTLGEDLRAATSDGNGTAIRSLSGRRTALENRVIADLSSHLAALGVSRSPAALAEVRTTLHAVLADADAADLVCTGRLAQALDYAGFGEVVLPPATVAEAELAPAPPGNAEAQQARIAAVEAVVAAEEVVASSEQGALLAERKVADGEAKVAQITDRLRSAKATLEGDRRQLADVRVQLEDARSALSRAREALSALEES